MKKVFISLAISAFVFMSCNNSNNMEKAEYSGEDITTVASIIRDKDSKAASLKIDVNGKWKIYAGSSVEEIDFSKPLLEGEGSGTYPLSVNDSVRSYFQLVTENGKGILADKHLPMAGGYNFRDLGGLKTKDGRYVKWGKIFRSDDLQNLTDSDLKYLASIPLISVVDFRSKSEISQGADKLPATATGYELSVDPGNVFDVEKLSKMSSDELVGVMKNINTLLVTDSVCINQYKAFFDLVQENKDVPLMFHCTAGKDRTGMGAALVLSALGVDENVIFDNYLESNYYLADKYAGYIKENPNFKPLFEVQKDYLQTGLDQIKKDHGSVENYLTKVLGVDIDKMREMYLY